MNEPTMYETRQALERMLVKQRIILALNGIAITFIVLLACVFVVQTTKVKEEILINRSYVDSITGQLDRMEKTESLQHENQ